MLFLMVWCAAPRRAKEWSHCAEVLGLIAEQSRPRAEPRRLPAEVARFRCAALKNRRFALKFSVYPLKQRLG